MEALTLREIADALNGRLEGLDDLRAGDEQRIDALSIDTRALEPGDLYLAIKGKRFDGHEFVAEALDKGACVVILDEGRIAPELTSRRFTRIVVRDTNRALLDLAAAYRRRFAPRVVGITGSTGKTATKELLGRALGGWSETVVAPGSFNNRVGVPLTLLEITGTTAHLVLELGTSSPGEIADLTRTAQPELGLVTNISAAHLAGLGSLEGVVREKAALIEGLPLHGVALLNRDDPSFESLRGVAPGRVVTWGRQRGVDYRGTGVRERPEGGVAFEVNGTPIELAWVGEHNVSNALAAFACAVELGMPPADVASALRHCPPPSMRLEVLRLGDKVIINDAYNANPASTTAALKTLAALSATGRKVVVLGDMLELGAAAGALHEKIGFELAAEGFDLVVLVGQHAGDILAGMQRRVGNVTGVVSLRGTGEALREVPPLLRAGDMVLIKGSRGLRLEELVKALSPVAPPGAAESEPGGVCNSGGSAA